MAELVDTANIVEPDKLPKDLEGFSSLGVNERGELFGVDDEGETKRVRGAAHLVLELARRTGVAEPSALDQFSPELRMAIEQVIDQKVHDQTAELAQRLDDVTAEKQSYTQHIVELEREVGDLKDQVEALRPLEDKLRDDFGERWVPREGSRIIYRQEDGYPSGPVEVIGEPYKKDDGQWHIKVAEGEGEKELLVSDVMRARTAATTALAPGQPQPRRSDFAAFWRPRYRGETTPVVRNGRVTEETEEVYVREPESSRRQRVGVTAAAVLLGGTLLGIGIADLVKDNGGKSTQKEAVLLQQQQTVLKKLDRNYESGIVHARHDKARNNLEQRQEKKIIGQSNKILMNQTGIQKALKALHGDVSGLKKVEAGETTRGSEGHGGSATSSGSSENTQATLSYRGDTVYTEVAKRVRERLGAKASTEKIKKATVYVLRLNGLRWRGGGWGIDAHRLPVGFRFKIPQNIAAVVNK